MPTIDDKVVSMSFESSKFESGVNTAIHSLEKLKAALQFKESAKNLVAVGNAAHQVDLGHIAEDVKGIESKLGALRLAAIAVFADIAKKGVAAGTALVKAFTIEPLKAGFQEYSTQLNSVQTILANTQASGATLKDVNRALDELNTYSDKTIYNFGQMARNIGTFTAAGVDLKTATASIKGIANLAALSGSNAEQAATAMYQLSQAISSGSVKLMDWNSVVNAGMGGTVFQRALALTGEHMGQLKKGTVQLVGPMKNVKIAGESFRNSLSAPGKDGWLTSDVLTKTLKMFTSDMTDAELAADGWNKSEIKAIQAQAKAAMLAATNVKTIQQVLAVAKETAGSGWAKTWRIIFGDFGEAKKTFTNLSNTINGMIIDSARARNNVLGDWKALGGRTVMIDAIKIAFHNLGEAIQPIKKAFRNIFPAITGKQLFDLTVRFKEFAEALKPSPETIQNLHKTFRGLFAILDIGKEIIFGVVGVFRDLLGEAGKGSGGFLEFTGNVGNALTAFHDWLIEGGKLAGFFSNLSRVLAAPVKALQFLASLFSQVFSGASGDGVGRMNKALTPLEAAFRRLGDALSLVFNKVKQLSGIFEPLLSAWVDLLAQITGMLGQAITTMNFEPILAVIRTGLLGGIFIMFKRFFGKGAAIDQLTKGLVQGFTGQFQGMAKNLNASLASLTNALVALQQQIKAKILKDIAISIALMAASMVVLSFIDPKKLDSAITGITVAFAELLGAMSILGNITRNLGFIKMPVIATTLIILAGAIFILSAAVAALSLLSWEQLAKGLGAVAILLGVISAAVIPLSASSFGMAKAGIGLMIIAVALNILAAAVLAFGSMNLMTLGKGMSAIGIGLFIIATYIKLMPSGVSMVAQGAGLIAIAVALNLLSLAVLSLGSMKLETLGKGLGAIGISLAIIAGAMHLMPKTMALQAAGLILVAAALIGIATAVQIMGGQSLTDLAKGLGGLAYSLGLLAGMLNLMSGAVPGAIALGIAAASIAILVPALIALGHQNIIVIATGLISLAVAFGIIAAAGILLDAAAPGLLAFGGAVALVGVGLALAGAGIFLAAAGFGALIAAVVLAVGVIPQALIKIQRSFIENAKLLVLGVLEIVKAFADVAPQFVDSIVKIVKSLLDAIIEIVPQVEKLVTILITTILRVLDQQQGPLIEGIIGLVMALLTGLRDHIGEITATALLIVRNFLQAIARNIGKVAKAGADVIIALIRGIAGNYARIVLAAVNVIAKFLNGIANNIGKIVTAGGNIIVKFLNGIAKNITKIAAAGTNVVVAFINAIGASGPKIVTAATNAIIKFINALQKNSNKIAEAGAVAIVKFLNGVADTIDNHGEEMRNAGIRIGKAIIGGMVAGLGDAAQNAYNKMTEIVGNLKKKAEFWKSPPSAYGKWLGQEVVLGLAKGLSDHTKAIDAAGAISNSVIDTFEDVLEIASPSKRMIRIGKEVTAGFAAGIKSGTEEDIRNSFAELKRKLNEQQASIQKQIARRDALERKKKPTKEETAELDKLIDSVGKHQKALQGAARAQEYLNKGIDKNKRKLFEQAKAYTDILQKIEDVNSLIQELKDQYSDLPEIVREAEDAEGETKKLTGAEQLAQYTKDLTAQVAAVKRYNEILQALRAAGLDDTTYRMLLEEGTTGLEFAQGLLDAGAPAIAQLKGLDTDLGSISDTLGKNAASNLYTAGKYAAQGLLDGLLAEKGAIEAEMERLGGVMVRAIKNKLKIKSPSEVFAEIGKLSMEGMAQGIADNSQNVSNSMDDAAQVALDTMRKKMQEVSSIVSDEINPEPVITPILDLTQVKSKAAELAALQNKFALDAAYGQAAAISSAQAATKAEEAVVSGVGGTSLKFEQNNYSPEALSNIEIYRQTKNQLSLLKSSLALT